MTTIAAGAPLDRQVKDVRVGIISAISSPARTHHR
jgi:hypothetical protein